MSTRGPSPAIAQAGLAPHRPTALLGTSVASASLHRINRGEMPVSAKSGELSDFFLVDVKDPEEGAAKVDAFGVVEITASATEQTLSSPLLCATLLLHPDPHYRGLIGLSRWM